MCTGIEIAMIAATAFSAVSAVQQGQQQKKYNEWQAAQAEAEAQAEREMGEIQGARVRRQGRSQQSEARAALAASGVEVGAGTPVQIQGEIERRSEVDALNYILYGERKGARLEQEAAASRLAGKNAQAAGYRGAIGSVLRGGAALSGPGWKTPRRDTGGDFLYDANSYDSGAVRIG